MEPIRSRISSRSAALALMLVALAAGTALGSDGVATLGSPPPEEDRGAGTSAVEDPMDGVLDYAACMRDHGIEMPDPRFVDGRLVMDVEAPADAGGEGSREDVLGSQFISANEACSHNLGVMDSTRDPAQEASIMEQLMAHARCMRDQGIDMPDPVMSGGAISIGGSIGPDGTTDLDYDPFSEAYRSAEQACRDVLPVGEVGGGPAAIGD